MKAFLWPFNCRSQLRFLDTSKWKDPVYELSNLFGNGVFTTMRVKNDGSPIALKLHLDRLSMNSFGISEDSIKNEIDYFIGNFIKNKYESHWLSLVLMMAPLKESPQVHVGCCIREIQDPPLSCAVLAVNSSARSNPTIKSTTWIKERQSLSDLKGETYNEVLLVDNDQIFEGLSSNFGVIDHNGALLTAPDDKVLPGTIMRLVKDACSKLNIVVREQCPNINEINNWRATFITSTSRLLLPIHQIDHHGFSKTFEPDESIKMIQFLLSQFLN